MEKNLYRKLCCIQSALKVPKTQYNKFGDYSYRNCEDIQEAVKPLMKEHGLVLVVGDELVQAGARYYIKAVAKLIDQDTGESVENTAFAREEETKKGMDASQITGSASSYARKYALNGLFCIDDTRDADTSRQQETGGRDGAGQARNSTKGSGSTKGGRSTKSAEDSSRTVGAEEISRLFAEMKRTGVRMETLLSAAGVDDFHKLTTALYGGLMKRFAATPDRPGSDYSSTVPPDDEADDGLPWNTPGRWPDGM